jgi:hypothetical protein
MLLLFERRPFLAFRYNELCSLETIPPLAIVKIKVNLTTAAGFSPKANFVCIFKVAVPDIPVLIQGPAHVQLDQSGQAFLQIVNCSPNPKHFSMVNLWVLSKM